MVVYPLIAKFQIFLVAPVLRIEVITTEINFGDFQGGGKIGAVAAVVQLALSVF